MSKKITNYYASNENPARVFVACVTSKNNLFLYENIKNLIQKLLCIKSLYLGQIVPNNLPRAAGTNRPTYRPPRDGRN
jgi:hypothetical protein